MKPKRLYQDVMQERLSHLRVAFSQCTILRCLFNSLEGLLLENATSFGLKASGLRQVLGASFFSLKRSDRKLKFERGFSPGATDFGRRIMYCFCLRNARIDVLAQCYTGAVAGDLDGRPTLPQWLSRTVVGGGAYIARENADSAQERCEKVLDGKLEYARRAHVANGNVPNREDKGVYAMGHL